jgi:hypothetical protein
MRVLCDVFEAGGVVLVLAGHVHNYQRSKPLLFSTRPQPDGKKIAENGHVDGDWTLDREFDGERVTVPRGIIYVITGGGGAPLHDTGRESKPNTWQEFTEKMVSSVHTYTVLDVTPDRLDLRQVDVEGRVVDRFAITKPRP